MEQVQGQMADVMGELLFDIPASVDEAAARALRERLSALGAFAALCIHTELVEDSDEIPVRRRKLGDLLEREMTGTPQQLLYVQWQRELMICVLTGRMDELLPQSLRPRLLHLAAEMSEYSKSCIAVSAPCGGLAELPERYSQVSTMIDYAVLTERPVFFAQELPEPHYDLSCRVLKSRLESAYLQAISEKEFLVAYHHLQRIVDQELDEDMRSIRRLKHRFLAKVENAMQIMGVEADDPAEKSPCRELFSGVVRENSIRGLLTAAEPIYALLDREAKGRQESGKPEEVLMFLETHFSDPTLDSTKVAEACGVSKSYVSRIVNHRGGSSFADYVNALRIGSVKEQLKSTALGVDEIGARAGYTNRWTLLRAFRRFVGMTPQEYRIYSAGRP